MRTLHLLRHAKSSWDDPDLADHDRPLSERGRRTATLMAAYQRRSGSRPTLVVCSSALRARQTLDLIAPGLGVDIRVQVDPTLYAASEQVVWQRVKALPDEHSEVMLIGHNPEFHELAASLATHGDDETRGRIRAKLPTGALVTVVWAADSWAALRRSDAVVHNFVTARDL